ncbi:hypothetical protein Q8F55_007595 [Vanrija albida]|uniref:Uncharacterized protein n=1 Tax=Vanrija albida TaxID=181172 RepID=A0ABR3PTY8_9TREE
MLPLVGVTSNEPFNWRDDVLEPVGIAMAILVPSVIVFFTLARITGWLPSNETLAKERAAALAQPHAAKLAAANGVRLGPVQYPTYSPPAPKPAPSPAPAPVAAAPAPAPAPPSPLADARLELAKYWAGLVTELIALDREGSAAAALSVKAETPLESNKSDSGASPGVGVFAAPAWDRQARQGRLVKSIELCEREYERVAAALKPTA